jgi:hypothetical protein
VEKEAHAVFRYIKTPSSREVRHADDLPSTSWSSRWRQQLTPRAHEPVILKILTRDASVDRSLMRGTSLSYQQLTLPSFTTISETLPLPFRRDASRITQLHPLKPYINNWLQPYRPATYSVFRYAPNGRIQYCISRRGYRPHMTYHCNDACEWAPFTAGRYCFHGYYDG